MFFTLTCFSCYLPTVFLSRVMWCCVMRLISWLYAGLMPPAVRQLQKDHIPGVGYHVGTGRSFSTAYDQRQWTLTEGFEEGDLWFRLPGPPTGPTRNSCQSLFCFSSTWNIAKTIKEPVSERRLHNSNIVAQVQVSSLFERSARVKPLSQVWEKDNPEFSSYQGQQTQKFPWNQLYQTQPRCRKLDRDKAQE